MSNGIKIILYCTYFTTNKFPMMRMINSRRFKGLRGRGNSGSWLFTFTGITLFFYLFINRATETNNFALSCGERGGGVFNYESGFKY